MTRVLIVDDTMTVILSLKMIFSKMAFDLDTAMCAEDGLAKAKANPPDIILSDVMMPGMNGPAFVRALKADVRTRNIPVVMVTTQSNDAIMKDCFYAGCAEYVTKPINSAELLTKIRSCVGE